MGRALALMLAALGLLQSPAPPTPAPLPTPLPAAEMPAPRQAIAGLKSIGCASTIVYAALPGAPHRLQATYAFPDRARWWLGVGEEPSTRRQMRFRFGRALYAVEPEKAASRKLEKAERAEAAIQLEMRRALFLWPHGFEWKRAGTRAVAPLADLGMLTATFKDASAKEPVALAFGDNDGATGDEYREITWRAEKDKSWPRHLELWHAKELVWNETVDAVDTRTRFIDSFFLPPDLRESAGTKPLEVGAVRPTDLPEHRSQRIALPPDTTWQAACKQLARSSAEQSARLKEHGLKLDDRATIEVSEELRPLALVLRLVPVREPLDPTLAAAWPLTAERPGLSTFVLGLPALEAPRLAALRRAAPADATCGAPYVRFDPAHPEQHVMILLPLLAKDENTPGSR